eukprot:jgi/Bigna1/81857/fgenesh1_pg.85_\
MTPELPHGNSSEHLHSLHTLVLLEHRAAGRGGSISENSLRLLAPALKLEQTILESGFSPETSSSSNSAEITRGLKRATPASDSGPLHQVIGHIRRAKRIMVLSGAGISVACGVPDFRSKGGIYDLIGDMDLELPQPECLFDLEYFQDDPKPFYQLAKKLLPAFLNKRKQGGEGGDRVETFQALPRPPVHQDDRSQEEATSVVQCHGSLSSGRCLKCKKKVAYEMLRRNLASGEVLHCTKSTRRWPCGGVIKPDITFFGEPVFK